MADTVTVETTIEVDPIDVLNALSTVDLVEYLLDRNGWTHAGAIELVTEIDLHMGTWTFTKKVKKWAKKELAKREGGY